MVTGMQMKTRFPFPSKCITISKHMGSHLICPPPQPLRSLLRERLPHQNTKRLHSGVEGGGAALETLSPDVTTNQRLKLYWSYWGYWCYWSYWSYWTDNLSSYSALSRLPPHPCNTLNKHCWKK
jgi:hypothetical protein